MTPEPTRRAPRALLALIAFTAAAGLSPARAEDRRIDTFDRQRLTDVYYSEGIAAGDLNRDGKADVVYGPYWFAGPDYAEKHEIYPAKPQPTEAYADHFFAWIHDFNGDGWADVLTVGFPGKPGYVYENPGAAGLADGRHWTRHEILDKVSNESPQFTPIDGDGRPDLVCSRDGFFGYASFDPARPFGPWTFHPVSEKVAPIPFGHGLGVGDVNGDGRRDLLIKDGWFEQPAPGSAEGPWVFRPAPFAPIGGADIHTLDVDGDGDADVITSLAAHDFGLAWYEQVREGDAIAFRQHLIMGDQPHQNRYGLVFSEPHSVILADVDGDGLPDIVTGKTYYSHHKQSPMWDAGAVVYWFRLNRTPDGVDWVPYKADGESGIGRQLVAHDLNGDGLVDLAAGGMKGAHVLIHRRETVDEATYRAAQPKVYRGEAKPALRGPKPALDPATGRVDGAQEGESLTVLEASAGQAGPQAMTGFSSGRWSGGAQLFWTGAAPGGRLELEVAAPGAGDFDVIAGFTLARDFGVVRLTLDGEPLGDGPLDLYHYPEVIHSGELTLARRRLAAGAHRLAVEIVGANPSALRAHRFGLDYVRFVPR